MLLSLIPPLPLFLCQTLGIPVPFLRLYPDMSYGFSGHDLTAVAPPTVAVLIRVPETPYAGGFRVGYIEDGGFTRLLPAVSHNRFVIIRRDRLPFNRAVLVEALTGKEVSLEVIATGRWHDLYDVVRTQLIKRGMPSWLVRQFFTGNFVTTVS